ncbi:3122_t:CDS:2 [Funneliformis mosseae]|uniref:3122_t:CDS:1 n=1 Tax=Funneliformis mosseae TaxID=27381 RepID=A0A9N9DR26_FUNMO|nr:3122_t:CDS:2 [Funneliformis mosseae]
MSKRMLFLMSITLLTLNTVNAFRGQGMLFLESDFKACGESDGDKDMFCALNSAQFNDCGKLIKIKGPKGNAIVKVKYECPTCSFGDLGLSPEVLSKIANPDDNEIPITWSFIGESDGFIHGHRNVPKVVPRAEEPAPEAPKDEPKTEEKEAPKEEPKETDEKEAPKEEPKETDEKEAPKDEPKETDEKEAPKEEPKESEEKEDPKDEPKEKEVKEAPKEEPKEKEDPKDEPKEKEAKEAPKKEPKEKETPKEEPKETKEKTPKDTPKENEAPKKAPKEKETTKKAPKKAPIQNPKVIEKPKGIKVAQEKIGITPVKVKNNPKVAKGLGTGGKSAQLVDDNKSTLKFGKEKEKKANNVSTKFGAGDPNVFIANNASNHTSTNDEDPNIDDDEDDDSRVIPATPTTTDQVLNENNNDQIQNEININKQLQSQNHQDSSNSMMKLELFSNKFTFITVLLAVTYLFD